MYQSASDTEDILYQPLLSPFYISHPARSLSSKPHLQQDLLKVINKIKTHHIHFLPHTFKMHFSNAAALTSALFSTIAFAAPSAESGWKPLTATLQLANDQSGTSANVIIPVDGVKRPVQELWGNTAVAHNGLVFASSVQLTDFQETTVCTITEEKHQLEASIDAEETWVSLGRPVVDLCSAYIVCKCEMEGFGAPF